ncbi:hypothetical protein ACHAXA_008686 [Cyclostephanos tholiformis]|uniref:Uncharacterized protein n=1 Tax=Cyclostephanos tholiformis TaxID=382380 RepID=A0ABD3RXA9_9STRA
MLKLLYVAFSLSLSLGHASAAGCYSAYIPGSTYSKGNVVSQVVVTTTPITYASCNVSPTCPTGWNQIGGVTTSSTHNFACFSDSWCSNIGYAPGSVFSDQAWTKDADACTGTQGSVVVSPAPTPGPSPAPTPPVWAGVGCPNEYAKGSVIAPGASVTVTKDGVKLVYKCKSHPASGWCPLDGYEPGSGIAWKEAWTLEGSCTGTLTASPPPPLVWAGVGCPDEYAKGAVIAPGASVTVTKDGVKLVYKCKSYPASGWCPLVGYEPGSGIAWKEAWTLEGSCDGTKSFAPTASPVSSLPNQSGCPVPYAKDVTYAAGDLVSKSGLVFKCNPYPMSQFCSQLGYEPLVKDSGAYKLAWTTLGPCSGTSAPSTSSPTTASVVSATGGCPDTYSPGVNYPAGSKVSKVTSNPAVIKKYECKPWPVSQYCSSNTYAPDGPYGYMAWTDLGQCFGTLAPTVSVVCNYLKYTTTTAYTITPTQIWSASAGYAVGDEVRVDNKAFRCKVAGWCNLFDYAPSLSAGLWRMGCGW